jgi:ATP-dependent Clp protease ATP-binding subunit ClpA
MYERFTDRARKVMQLANQEAQRFNHEYIGTEHILLGLVREGSGVAANVLKNLDVSLRKIRREVEKVVQPGPFLVPWTRLPQTPMAKVVLGYSIEEARNLNHNYVGTEHLLLGLLREQEGVAAQVLLNLGLKLEDVREEVLNLLGHNLRATKGDNANPVPAKAVKIDRCLVPAGQADNSETCSPANSARRAGGWVREYGATIVGGLLAPFLGAAIGVVSEGSGAACSGALTGGVIYLATVALTRGASGRGGCGRR